MAYPTGGVWDDMPRAEDGLSRHAIAPRTSLGPWQAAYAPGIKTMALWGLWVGGAVRSSTACWLHGHVGAWALIPGIGVRDLGLYRHVDMVMCERWLC